MLAEPRWEWGCCWPDAQEWDATGIVSTAEKVNFPQTASKSESMFRSQTCEDLMKTKACFSIIKHSVYGKWFIDPWKPTNELPMSVTDKTWVKSSHWNLEVHMQLLLIFKMDRGWRRVFKQYLWQQKDSLLNGRRYSSMMHPTGG